MSDKKISEAEVDRILKTIPSSKDRLNLYVHMVMLEHAAKNPSGGDLRKAVEWVRASFTNGSVRSNFAQKLADRLEAGEHLVS